ncbi:hypothetical protein SFC07_05375 [Corynebacterium callunae]|uniref:hypothetical protein n=1 Tax=Corynebacterium callunae TaxID=1721 RepID=UPI003981DC3F
MISKSASTFGFMAVLLLGAVACTPADRPSEQPRQNTPIYTQQSQPLTHYGPGLYQLQLAKNQALTCVFSEPTAVSPTRAECAAGFPTTWKLLDETHAQAATLIISQDAAGAIAVNASKEPLITIQIVPTSITGSAEIAGMKVTLQENEARFSIASDPAHTVLITPDSYEAIEAANSPMSSAAKVSDT